MNLITRSIRFFLDCLFPIECLGCGKENFWICNDCLASIQLKKDFPCIVCGKPTIFGKTHQECLVKTSVDRAFCATFYEDKLVQEAIRAYKYRFVLDLGRSLTWLMAKFIKQLQNTFPESVLGPLGVDCLSSDKVDNQSLLPVPLHPKRLRERDFNQAEILARELAKYFNWQVLTRVLLRKKYTKSQVTLKSKERERNIKNAFTCVDNEKVKNKIIILIDDVLTTGATANEAARVLKLAGAKEVWVFCLAKD